LGKKAEIEVKDVFKVLFHSKLSRLNASRSLAGSGKPGILRELSKKVRSP